MVTQIKQLIIDAYSNTKRTDNNRTFSILWIKSLAEEFKKYYSSDKYVIFQKHDYTHRKEFRLNEFLYDIHICEIENCISPKKIDIKIIKKAIWQIESEFKSNDFRGLFNDFSKLVVGNAENKLFVTTANNRNKDYKDYFLPIAYNCTGTLFLSILPALSIYGQTSQIEIYKYSNQKWESI